MRLTPRLFVFIFITAVLLPNRLSAADVVTCGDASIVGKEAHILLHEAAQQRAQNAVEALVERQVARPYGTRVGKVGENITDLIPLIEIFWCGSSDTPLHSAYFNFYTNNKSLFFKTDAEYYRHEADK